MNTELKTILFWLVAGMGMMGCQDATILPWSEMSSPAGPDSEVPNLHAAPDGSVYMSWVEWTDDTTSVLYVSRFYQQVWSAKKEIARGTDWFVNWADYPGISAFSDGMHLAAHWMQKSAAGRYDYNVMISISSDGGFTWGVPFILHQDTVPAEHGFVSTTRDGDRLFYAWLDGRKMAGEDHSVGHGEHSGRMLLLGTWLDKEGTRSDEQVLDTMTCECCQTNVVKTNSGLLVTYRDRSDEEIRDISHVIWDGRSWSNPATETPDHWKIGGCPVNGPAAVALGDTVYRVWYGKKDTLDHVSLILSTDGGSEWNTPVVLEEDGPLGRVDVASRGKQAWVSWIGLDSSDSTWIKVATFENMKIRSKGTPLCRIDPRRKSGFPQLAAYSGGVLMAYTAVEGEKTGVKVMSQHN